MAATTANPVFVRARDLPVTDNRRPPTVLEICLAAERTAGTGSVAGAQQIGGLWRIYPTAKEARTQLLVQGLRISGTVIQLANVNPYVVRDEGGEEKPTTKVFVDNVPISVADSEIEAALTKVGCELRSSVKAERARDPDGKLTRFLTGRRFVFITVPPVPLDQSLRISIFNAKVYHREQKLTKKAVICSNCLEANHHFSQCIKDVVCMTCRSSGHKRGDPACKLAPAEQSGEDRRMDMAQRQDSAEETPVRMSGKNGERVRSESKESNECESMTNEKGNESELQKQKQQQKKEQEERKNRGRTASRQALLGTSLELRRSPHSPRSPRKRSETPKRPRSTEDSPETESNKKVTRSKYRSVSQSCGSVQR